MVHSITHENRPFIWIPSSRSYVILQEHLPADGRKRRRTKKVSDELRKELNSSGGERLTVSTEGAEEAQDEREIGPPSPPSL